VEGLDRLGRAVDLLAKERTVHTIIRDDDTGEVITLHAEPHPPLLVLLVQDTGLSRGAASSTIKIPIDADSIELAQSIRKTVRDWCAEIGFPFDGNVCTSLIAWAERYASYYFDQLVGEEKWQERLWIVEGWVHTIESKFDPDDKLEWTDPCPAFITYNDTDGLYQTKRCGARRVLLDGVMQFAVDVNITKMHAECRSCMTTWDGVQGFMSLRMLSNAYSEELDGSGHAA
jgi:hypothetical protein